MAPRVAVFGAAGFAGALAARLLYEHPSFELADVTARSDVGTSLDRLYPQHRVRLSSRSSTSIGTATSTRRSSPTRTARPPRWWRSYGAAGSASST